MPPRIAARASCPGRGTRHAPAKRFDDFANELARCRVIVHHQHAQLRSWLLPGPVAALVSVCSASGRLNQNSLPWPGSLCARRSRRPSARPVVCRSTSRGGCRQSAGSSDVGLGERRKQTFDLPGTDADAGIAHAEAKLRPVVGTVEQVDLQYYFAVLGELDRVGYQIGRYLLQLQRVAIQMLRYIPGDMDDQLDILCAALIDMIDDSRSIMSARLNATGCNFNLPASILEKSRMSLMIPSSDLPAWLICATYSCWLSASPVFSNRCAIPSTAFSGDADFVAHVGEKVAFCSAGRFSGNLGGTQLGLDLFLARDIIGDADKAFGSPARVTDHRYGQIYQQHPCHPCAIHTAIRAIRRRVAAESSQR